MKKEKLKWRRNNSNREFSRPSIFSLRPEYTDKRIRFLIFNLVWTNNIKVVFSFVSFCDSVCVSVFVWLCVGVCGVCVVCVCVGVNIFLCVWVCERDCVYAFLLWITLFTDISKKYYILYRLYYLENSIKEHPLNTNIYP